MKEQDKAFAEKVNQEYPKLPLDQLCEMVATVRIIIDTEKQYKPLKTPCSGLLDPELEVQEFVLKTNKGDITINKVHQPQDFRALENGLEILKNIQKKEYDSFVKYLDRVSMQGPMLKTKLFLDETPLGEFQKRVVIGMFIVHFELYRPDKPILTEKEWQKSDKHDQSYKHYLADIVKNRLKADFKYFYL